MKYFQYIHEKFSDKEEENEYRLLADNAKDIYIKNLNKLPWMKRQHLLSRLSLVYGSHWKADLDALYDKMVLRLGTFWSEVANGDYDKVLDNHFSARKGNNVVHQSREEGDKWLLDNPDWNQIIAYGTILQLYSILHRQGRLQRIVNHKEIGAWLKDNWQRNVKIILKNPISLYHVPVQMTNIIYYMMPLQLVNTGYWNEVEDEFLNMTNNMDIQNNLVPSAYVLTHILIGRSQFYLKPVTERKYEGILKQLNSMKEILLKIDQLDIVAEIGVCNQICNQPPDWYQREIAERMNPILNKDRGINNAEHSNILAIMLLHGWA